MGHVISVVGVAVDPKKIEVIRDWPKSTTIIEVRSFMGLAGYFTVGLWKALRSFPHPLLV